MQVGDPTLSAMLPQL